MSIVEMSVSQELVLLWREGFKNSSQLIFHGFTWKYIWIERTVDSSYIAQYSSSFPYLNAGDAIKNLSRY